MAKRIKQKLNPYRFQNFTCDNCQEDYEQKTAYSPAPNLEQLDDYYTYCSNCVEINKEEKPKQSSKKKNQRFWSSANRSQWKFAFTRNWQKNFTEN